MSASMHDNTVAGVSQSRLNIIKLALGVPKIEDLPKALKQATPGITLQAIEASLLDAGLGKYTEKVRLANVVADAVDENVDIAAKILQDTRINSARDVAINYGFGRVMSLAASGKAIGKASEQQSAALTSTSHGEGAKTFALRFRRRIFVIEPTAVLQQMIASNDENENPSENLPIHTSAEVRTEVAGFLARRPEFNIRTTSVLAALHKDQGSLQKLDVKVRTAVVRSLKLLQRVQALVPVPEAVKPLLEADLVSAMQVSSIPKKQFIAGLAPRLAESSASPQETEHLAAKIHDHAMMSHLRADNALIQIHQTVRGTGLKALDDESTMADRHSMFDRLAGDKTGAPTAVNLDTLFGDMDMCECEACLDVTSPTAYYVDLLQYLRNNNLDAEWGNTGREGIAGTAVEKLFLRRPDLQHLQLTCANANTTLPMVDLANEVMEASVIHQAEFTSEGRAVIETWNVGRETTDELLASPSHTRKKAYCILKSAVYPLARLSYFQPLDASRLYLEYLGTSRFELIDTFRSARRQWAVRPEHVATPEAADRYALLRDQLQDRAAAAEYLGLSPDDYVIITRESLWPIGCSEFADDGVITDIEEYRTTIGVRNPFAYWGYSTDAAVLSLDDVQKSGLSFVKAQFLPRSGLSYAETAELARTKFVNPMMPMGKDKVLMDAIRFSYRLLQHLALGLTDTAERNEALGRFLFGTQPFEQQQTPSSEPVRVYTKGELTDWIAKWFDCVGKLTVLESGQGPRLQLPPGYLVLNRLGCGTSWGYLDQKGELRDEKNQLVGFVWMDGQVYYNDLRPIRATYEFVNIFFIPSPKLDPAPTAEEVMEHSPDDIVVWVDKESRLVVWSTEKTSTVKWMAPADSCSIEGTVLVHLNGTPLELWEWDRINRFIRLFKKLESSGWTISQLDAALTGLWKVPEISSSDQGQFTSSAGGDTGFSFSSFGDTTCECSSSGEDCGSLCDPKNYIDITPGFLKELMGVEKLKRLSGLEPEKLLCLWSDIGTSGEKSLYSRLFLTHDLESMDNVLVPDEDGNYLSAQPRLGDHIPVIAAALRIKISIFDAVLERVGLTSDSKITIAGLTKLYRHSLLSSMLGMKSDALIDALDLFGDPYRSASATLGVYELWSRISAASFTIKQLRYITVDVDDPLRPIGPVKVKVLRTTKVIIDGLTAIDIAHPDLTTQEEAVLTAAQVKAKAALILDPPVADDIMGLIEGTKVFTTNAPAGLALGGVQISSKIVYKDSDTTSSRGATLSVKGCLTDSEMATALAIFLGNDGWESALRRLQRQAENLIKNTLAAVFSEDANAAVEALTQGDVAAANPGDPETALPKRVFFMRKLMPFLRSRLYTKLIITTMSGIASVPADISAWLLSEVIKVGAGAGAGAGGSQKPAMQVLVDLKSHRTSGTSGTWTGYLIPPTSDAYAFYGYGDARPPPLILDGTSIPFETQNEDPSNLWWTAPVTLVGGKVVNLQISGQTVPGDLKWKTERSGVVPVPPSALVPDASAADAMSIFAPLSKASMVIRAFYFSLTELEYLQRHGSNFSGVDFGAITFDACKRLLAYYELRKALPSRETSLIDLLKWASRQDMATADEISKMVSAVTAWDVASVKILLDSQNMDLGDLRHFRDEIAMTKLVRIFAFTRKVGITDMNLVLSWTDLKLDFGPTWKLAKSIRQTIRGKYTASDYEQAIKPSHDRLRKNQRDALIAYLLVQPAIREWGAIDADGLFEFFLLDVQMGSCMQTSRTKQAISSVQLFVQRCILGLEEKYGIPNDALDAERWKSMSKQTISTAHRKVYIGAESWLISSLRDNKTPIYVEMESEMLQREVKPANVLESFRGYVTRLGQIAQLRAVGLHVEKDEGDNYVLHCVAMTAGLPYLFFYRKYDSSAHTWTPWIRISVDIPTYTMQWPIDVPIHLAVPDGDLGVGSVTGCYVTPVPWMSRTLLFIGEIAKTTTLNTGREEPTLGRITARDSTETASSMAPWEAWEVKLAWTEYRSGKWTQKMVASEPFRTPAGPANSLPGIDSFQFIPRVVSNEYVSIEIWHSGGGSQVFDGNYEFNGTVLQKGNLKNSNEPKLPGGWLATSFHLVNGRMPDFITSSLQKSADGTTLEYLNKPPYVSYKEDLKGQVCYLDLSKDIFYHPFSSKLAGATATLTEDTGIEPMELVYQSLTSDLIDSTFGTIPSTTAEGESTFAELSKPYTNYNWELGFYGPMHVAEVLSKSQQFDQALAMMHQVFNPYADGDDIRRVWQWYPFKVSNPHHVLEALLNQLKPRQPDVNITQWRDHPFQPFVIARGRIVAFMKWTVMLYLKTLIAYGDMYFRRRALEDIPLAIQLYVLASHMFGPQGETIPKRGKKKPQTYFSLLDKWDAFSNAVVQLEIAFPFSNQTPFPWPLGDEAQEPKPSDRQLAQANLFGFATSSYFCLPSNPELLALRRTIDQRLYNIRNCLDIDGRPMPLVLWDAPVDPGELVAAVASGLSLSSALNDLNASLPNYRFTWLLARAYEMTAELKGLEGAFLSIKEKRDGEALQQLKSGHDIVVHRMVMEIKKVQLEEAAHTLVALQASQESSKHRFDFYSRLAGVDVKPLDSKGEPFKPKAIDIDIPAAGDTHINSMEMESEDQAETAEFLHDIASHHEVMAGILHAVPSFNIHSEPAGCGVETAWGMPNIASAYQATAHVYQIIAGKHSQKSSKAGRKAGFIKQYQDRVHQMNLAGLEFEHINKQITAHITRTKMATMDIENQQKIIDNAIEVDDFLRNKYTNDDLYSYLESTTRTTLYQTYLLAYDLAKKAELAFRFERRPSAGQSAVDFISFGYFNPARDGLQASHMLHLALKAMEAAYQDTRGHDYELTKSVSLRQLNPYALLTLRESGACAFDIPEVVFDMDFPGHYFRRIKTVSLTVPCVVGPHVGVSATLRLLKHRYRADSLAASGRDYLEDTSGGGGLDPRFRTAIVPIDAVATSSGQSDGGAFELSLKDERYVPFEGAGAISRWQMTLPPNDFRPFDYASIADVVLTMRYTACEGGEALRRAAAESVVDWVASVEGRSKDVGLLALWDIRAEFAAEWAKLSGPHAGSGDDVRTLVLRGLNGRLPSFVAGRDPDKVRATDVSLVTTLPFAQHADLSLDFKYVPGGEGDGEVTFDSGPLKVGSMGMFRISDADDPFGDWALKVKMAPGMRVDSTSRIWMIVRYRLLKRT
ncbi:hypothetical protein FSOLCH5_015286 [Fusarium solani]